MLILPFRSVQMRLYALHKRQVVAVFGVFFAGVLLTILIGMTGPSVIQTSRVKQLNQPELLVGQFTLHFAIHPAKSS